MSIRVLYLIIIVAVFTFQTNKTILTKWVVTNGCSLKVEGSTNVNQFSCDIANYNTPDTIWFSRSSKPAVHLLGNLRLDVQKFDCHHLIMTADLRKTLNAKEHPYLIIRFLTLNKYPGDVKTNDITKGMVVIELSGVSKKFEVDYKVASAAKGVIHLVGTRQVKFSDFNISPPRKLGGMIRTEDELKVVFNLRMKALYN